MLRATDSRPFVPDTIKLFPYSHHFVLSEFISFDHLRAKATNILGS